MGDRSSSHRNRRLHDELQVRARHLSPSAPLQQEMGAMENSPDKRQHVGWRAYLRRGFIGLLLIIIVVLQGRHAFIYYEYISAINQPNWGSVFIDLAPTTHFLSKQYGFHGAPYMVLSSVKGADDTDILEVVSLDFLYMNGSHIPWESVPTISPKKGKWYIEGCLSPPMTDIMARIQVKVSRNGVVSQETVDIRLLLKTSVLKGNFFLNWCDPRVL